LNASQTVFAESMSERQSIRSIASPTSLPNVRRLDFVVSRARKARNLSIARPSAGRRPSATSSPASVSEFLSRVNLLRNVSNRSAAASSRAVFLANASVERSTWRFSSP
jgi:hypothetical protein